MKRLLFLLWIPTLLHGQINDPTEISGLRAWFITDSLTAAHMADETGPDDEDSIDDFPDFSTNTNDMVSSSCVDCSGQPKYDTNILNSRPSARFDSSQAFAQPGVANEDWKFLHSDSHTFAFVYQMLSENPSGGIETVINTDGNNANNSGVRLVNASNGANDRTFDWWMTNGSGSLAFRLKVDQFFKSDSFHVVICVFDSGSATNDGDVWKSINGNTLTKIDSADLSAALSTSNPTQQMQFGRMADTEDYFLFGQLPELIFYDRALNNSEVSDLFDYIKDRYWPDAAPETGTAANVRRRGQARTVIHKTAAAY